MTNANTGADSDCASFFTNHTCRICSRNCKNRRSLGNHLVRSHPGWGTERYVLEYLHNNEIPKCACGCAGQVKWHRTQYRFNKFLDGHNSAWSSTHQPKITPEQTELRIAAIRIAYKDHGAEIRGKISSAVQKSLSRPEWKAGQTKRKLALWKNNPEFRKRFSDSQKRAWAENYQERYDATFTDEFRRKISLSNARRDIKRKSQQEVEFFGALKESIGIDVQSDKWVNWEGGSKCYDAWVPEWNLLVEFDGLYWHGLDRRDGFTVDQVANMANDFLKNRIARDLGHSLARISMTPATLQELRKAHTIEDLEALSRHFQHPAGTTKDGMFRFEDDKHALVHRDDIIRWNEPSLGGKGPDETRERALPAATDFFREYFQDPTRGWFFPKTNDTADDALASVRLAESTVEGGSVHGSPRAGNEFLRSRMRSFWHAGGGPAVLCTNSKILGRVLSYRLGLNNSKPYTYTLSTGEVVTTRETFDLCPKTVRNGFVVQRTAVSWFSPVIARDLWNLVLEGCGTETPIVWDPSAGFGARLLGFAAAFPTGTYTSTEPATQTFEDLEKLRIELMSSEGFRGKIVLEKMGSEKMKIEEETIDAVMTSPPYFDLEQYFDEPGQCWKDYPNFDAWRDLYLRPTLTTAHFALKKGGKMAINVSQKLTDVVVEISHAVGFNHISTVPFGLHRDHFSRKKGTTDPLRESVLLFQKCSE